jgi:ribosomal-protein-alanine acetyltransferase
MSDIEIKPMRIRHIPEILKIESRVFALPWSEDMFRFELSRMGVSRLYVALLRNRVVGYEMAWFLEDEVHLINIAVAPEYQHRKIGSRLLEHLIAEATRAGAGSITLEVRKSNRRAQTFYRAFHFEYIGVRDNYYSDNQEDAILLMLDLEAYARLAASGTRKHGLRRPVPINPPPFFSKKKRTRMGLPPLIDLAVILGSGLGGTCRGLKTDAVFGFEEVPGLTRPQVSGHPGEFRVCRLDLGACLFVLGRRHHYEESDEDIRLLIEFIASLGVDKLVVTSAAGSLHAGLAPGRLVLVDRLVDLQNRSQSQVLIDRQPEWTFGRTGKREGPVGELGRVSIRLPLDDQLNRRLQAAAARAGVPLDRATMACLAGPNYETPAEVKALQLIGADIAAMSAAPEIEYSTGRGIRVAVLSVVTNLATGIKTGRLRHDEVLSTAARAASDLKHLLMQFGSGGGEMGRP